MLNSKLDLLSEHSISFLRILCDYAAIAIQNARSMTLIQELTITDDVTGLFNARHLYTMLDEQVALGKVFSLMFVDLDHFKSVNDTHGHLIGSRLLAEIGGLLKRSLGPNNAAFRYGGDEFVALLPGMGKAAASGTTMALCEDLRNARFLEGAGLSLHVSGSFGLATFPEDGDTVQTILRSADTMMYEAKKTRNNVAVAGKGTMDWEEMAEKTSGSRRAVSEMFVERDHRCLATRPFPLCRKALSLFNSPDALWALVGLVTLERDGAAGVGLDDVAVFGGDGVDSEVPYSQVDGLVGDDLHEGKLTEVEGFLGGDLEPVTPGKELGGGFDDVLLVLACCREG